MYPYRSIAALLNVPQISKQQDEQWRQEPESLQQMFLGLTRMHTLVLHSNTSAHTHTQIET